MVATTSSMVDVERSSTANAREFEVSAPVTTRTVPDTAVGGTITRNTSEVPSNGVAATPLNKTVLAAKFESKPCPDNVTATPTSELGGHTDARCSGCDATVVKSDTPGLVRAPPPLAVTAPVKTTSYTVATSSCRRRHRHLAIGIGEAEGRERCARRRRADRTTRP